jgi:hypothetical protein
MLPSAKQCMMKDLDYETLPLITNGLYNFSGDKSNINPSPSSQSVDHAVCGQTISPATLGASTIDTDHSPVITSSTHPRTHAQPSVRTGTAADVVQPNHLRCLSRRPAESKPRRLPSPNRTTGDHGVMSTLPVVFFPVK